MPFKPPGGELTVWSAIWVAFGVFALVVGFLTGAQTYFILAVSVGLPALGMWFDQRWCGYVFAGVLAIAILLALFALVTIDDTLWEWVYRLFRVGMAVYFAFLSWRWARGE
jgi:hypothetical protein